MPEGNRVLLAEALGGDASGIDAEFDDVGAHGQGAPLAEGQVVFPVAALVAMAFHHQPGLRGASHLAGHRIRLHPLAGPDPGAVVLEIHGGELAGVRGPKLVDAHAGVERVFVHPAEAFRERTPPMISGFTPDPLAFFVFRQPGATIRQANPSINSITNRLFFFIISCLLPCGFLVRARGHHGDQDGEYQSP